MTENFKPKCLLTDRVPACTATGHIVPCCWVDNPMGWKDPIIAKFYQENMHLDKNDSVDDIVNSDTWYEWFNMLRYHPEQAPDVCKKYCSLPVNEWITRKVERND